MTFPSGYRSSHHRANLAARYVLPLAWQALTATSGLLATARMMSRWRRQRTEPSTSLAKCTGSVSDVGILFLDGVFIRILGGARVRGAFQQCSGCIDGNQSFPVWSRVFEPAGFPPPESALHPENGRSWAHARGREVVQGRAHTSVGYVRSGVQHYAEVLPQGLCVDAEHTCNRV